ncbi:MAG: ATP-binding protein [Quisquiliibacterium sp.]
MGELLPVCRVGIVGAECSGKTCLARALAGEFDVPWVPELLREFCDLQGRPPRAKEQRELMREQIWRESQALKQASEHGASFLICDCTPLVTALYSQVLFEDESLLLEARAHQTAYRVTLLTDVDIDWKPDGIQRDGEAARSRFDQVLRDRLRQYRIAHTLITGKPLDRLAKAKQVLRDLRDLPPAAVAYTHGSR